jgi:hypothetical protein
LSESNQRPTDYKSVALPAELKWHFPLTHSRKELPQIRRIALFFGKAKVSEFVKFKNFAVLFLAHYQAILTKNDLAVRYLMKKDL